MKEFFRRLFNIYAGEEKNACLFACLGFLWALGITSGLKFADALFLIHIGASSLPIAYFLIASVMIVLAAFLLKAFHIISIHRIFITVLLIGALFYTSIYCCLLFEIGAESTWLWFALKIVGSILFALMMTCFWTFIDQFYHLQDAKRLYSVFTSAIFLGAATTGMIMRSGMIDFQNLTLIISSILLFSAYWVTHITRQVKPVYDDSALEITRGEYPDNSFRFLIQSIAKSRFTQLLMTGNFLIYLFMITTEYSYLSAFDLYFDPGTMSVTGNEEKANLTLFLGQCIAVVGLINLIFGLFFYSRFVRRFGVNNMLLMTPIFLLITYTGWSFSDALIFPVMGFFVVEGMLYIIDDNNFTLLLNAVPPKVKYKIRLIIESFFEPVGMLVSSLLISFSPLDSKTLGLILAGLALVVAFLLRRQYLKAIYVTLSENAIHFQRRIPDWFTGISYKEKRRAEKRLFVLMQNADEKAQLMAIEALLSLEDPKVLPRILEKGDQLSQSGKMEFLNIIIKSSYKRDGYVTKHIQLWLKKTYNIHLIGAINFYLAQCGLLPRKEALQDITSTDIIRKAASILALKKSWREVSSEVARADQQLAEEALEGLLKSDNDDAVCMGITVLGLDSFTHQAGYTSFVLKKLRNTRDRTLQQSCLRALGKIGSVSCIKEMIVCSIHFRPNERRLAEAAICEIGTGATQLLLNILQDISMDDRSRILAGRILGRLSLSDLRTHLYDIVSKEIERAYFYFYHLHYIQSDRSGADLSLLREDLESDFHSVVDFIIQLLGVAGESENCELLSHSLRSPNPKVRSHVVETLEKTCEPSIFRALYPLIADLPHAEKMRAYLKEGRKPLSLTELLDKMSHSPIQGDQIVALALRYRLDLPNWRTDLKEQLNSREELFHHFAYELLENE